MAADEILVEASRDVWRAAIVAEGRLVDLITVRVDGNSAPGAIHLGRVVRVLPGMGGAFVEIGLDRAALLDIGNGPPREGDIVTVQIIEDAAGDKAARVSMRVALAAQSLVLLPGDSGVTVSKRIADATERRRLTKILAGLQRDGEGIIIRSAAAADDTSMAAELSALRTHWQTIVNRRDTVSPPSCLHREPPVARLLTELRTLAPRRIVADTSATVRAMRDASPDFAGRIAVNDERGALFERYDIPDALAALENKHVTLPSGGALAIEPTTALTAIDVDSGAAQGAKLRLATNLEAAKEAARQIRLRDIFGLIMIDFIRMDAKADRARLLAELRAATSSDRRPVQVLGYTAAGLVELIRSRSRSVNIM